MLSPSPRARLALPLLVAAIGACDGARYDRLPIADVTTSDAHDAALPDIVRPDGNRPVDVATDVARDVAADVITTTDATDVAEAAVDAPVDVAIDTVEDAAPDAGIDASGDTGDDVTAEASVVDAGIDAGNDVIADDAGIDAADDVFVDDAGDEPVDEDTGPPPGPPLIQVNLSWDGPGDLDLHLHNGNFTPWFTLNDAWAAQPTPSWDNPGFQDDPWVYATSTMDHGFEGAQLQSPHPAEAYTVAVHNVAGGAGTHATILIFCGTGGAQVPYSFVSNPLAGTESGDCTGNDFWIVARIVLDGSGACNVAPINTYEPSSAACTTPP